MKRVGSLIQELRIQGKLDVVNGDANIESKHRIASETDTAGASAGKTDSKTHSSQQSSEANRSFGNYELVQVLGEGGMGAVYLAKDKRSGAHVALKLPKFNQPNRDEMLSRFQREARTAASLSHPNICPIREFGEVNGQFFLVMNYIRGVPLSKFLKENPEIAPRQVALLIRKLARAVSAAHKQGVIHRDLKPGNVMVNQRREPIVMDFGLARDTARDDTQLTKTGAFLGTPAYVSPEQITNRKGEVDHRTDIYSLGVVLYRMLAGCLPYQAYNSVNMIAQVLTGGAKPPSAYNPRACPRLSEIAMKAMARDVTIRYQSMEEFARDLTKYLKGETQPLAKVATEGSRQNVSYPNDELFDGTNSLDQEVIDFLNIDLAAYEKSSGVARSRTPRQALPPRRPTAAQREQQARKKIDSELDQEARSDVGTAWVQENQQLLWISSAAIAVVAAIWAMFSGAVESSEAFGTVTISMEGVPDERASITVDGNPVDADELRVGYRLPVGPHALIVRAVGFETRAIEFIVKEGQEEHLEFSFVPTPPPPDWINDQLGNANQPRVPMEQSNGDVEDDPANQAPSTPVSDRPDVVFADFEDGTYGDWTPEGVAFGQKPYSPWENPSALNSAMSGLNGKYVIDSYFTDEGYGDQKLTGKLTSPTFTVERQFINFLATRGKPGSAAIRLIHNDRVVLTEDGRSSLGLVMRPITWYVGDLLGESVHIEIVDESQDTDGHIGADLFVFSDADRTDDIRGSVMESVRQASVTWNDRQYYFSPLATSIWSAKKFAELVGGQLVQIESAEEAQFVADRMVEPVWLGITKQDEVWRGENGNVYTHGRWRDGLPEHDHYGWIVLGESAQFDWTSQGNHPFVVEFGPTEPLPVYTIQEPDANRQAAQLLLQKGAAIVIATAERFYWLSGNETLPAEDFELRKVVFSNPTRLTLAEVSAFKDVSTITWFELNNCDDSVLALVQFMPNLRRLAIRGGQYSWQPLLAMQEGHPLRKLYLERVTVNGRQLSPLFDAAALEELSFTIMSLTPEIGSLFIKQKASLRELRFNAAGGLTTAGFRNLRLLKELRHLMLWGTDFSDSDMKYVTGLTKLTWLGFGENRRVTGTKLHYLKTLEDLHYLRLTHTQTNDIGFSRLPVLPKLETLIVGKTMVTNEGLSHLADFSTLKTLELEETAIDDRGLEPLLELPNLRRIQAAKTRVTRKMMQRFADTRQGFTSDLLP